MRLPAWLRPDRTWFVAGLAALTVLYVTRYGVHPAAPGNVPQYPEGWWGWFDQGKYIESTRAFAAFDFSAARHWYPLAYPALGALFVRLSPLHAFYVPDLVCLLACFAGFVAFSRRIGVGVGSAVVVFLVSNASNRLIFSEWVIPWTTTPVAALLWVLLACVARSLQGGGGAVWIGVLAALVPLVRPTEAVLAGLCALASVPWDSRRAIRHVAWLVVGGAVPVLVYAGLHLAIYGAAPSGYMVASRQLGFTLHGFGWKAYTILIDPAPWFMDGAGMLRFAPFMALSLGGLAVAWAHGRAAALLSVLLMVHTALYISYVDLLPTGLWRYGNVHYWKWAFPGFGLMAFLLVRDLWLWRRAAWFPLAPVAALVSVPILCLHVVPVTAAADKPARMLAYAGPSPGFSETYFGGPVLRDDVGELSGLGAFRSIPVPGGMRTYAVRRDFVGVPRWEVPPVGWSGEAVPTRYAARLRIGRPCWMPRIRCAPNTNDLLPAYANP